MGRDARAARHHRYRDCRSRRADRGLGRACRRGIDDRGGGLDETARPALAAAARYGVLILALVAALSQLGVQTASLLAALGAAGLAIGLALQSTLSNIAAGIMLLWLRPFRVGDYIEVVAGNAIAGTVKEIGLFASRLETFDGLYVFAPNSALWNFAVRNHSRNIGRIICFTVSLPAGADVDRARDVLLGAVRPLAMERPRPEIFIDNLSAGAPLLTCRFWAEHDKITEAQRRVLDAARRALETASPDLRPTHIVRTVPPDSDPSRLL
ncbi:MAG TPA: mechanosensitive ion channel family protein [Roseiarcus sp.]|nr:mechanosensitive ion channel family protein [Roseiarcus sp.]